MPGRILEYKFISALGKLAVNKSENMESLDLGGHLCIILTIPTNFCGTIPQ